MEADSPCTTTPPAITSTDDNAVIKLQCTNFSVPVNKARYKELIVLYANKDIDSHIFIPEKYGATYETLKVLQHYIHGKLRIGTEHHISLLMMGNYIGLTRMCDEIMLDMNVMSFKHVSLNVFRLVSEMVPTRRINFMTEVMYRHLHDWKVTQLGAIWFIRLLLQFPSSKSRIYGIWSGSGQPSLSIIWAPLMCIRQIYRNRWEVIDKVSNMSMVVKQWGSTSMLELQYPHGRVIVHRPSGIAVRSTPTQKLSPIMRCGRLIVLGTSCIDMNDDGATFQITKRQRRLFLHMNNMFTAIWYQIDSKDRLYAMSTLGDIWRSSSISLSNVQNAYIKWAPLLKDIWPKQGEDFEYSTFEYENDTIMVYIINNTITMLNTDTNDVLLENYTPLFKYEIDEISYAIGVLTVHLIVMHDLDTGLCYKLHCQGTSWHFVRDVYPLYVRPPNINMQRKLNLKQCFKHLPL